MTYVGLLWRFEMVARVSEYTSTETAAKDSCIRLWQISFVVEAARAQPERDVTGGSLSRITRYAWS